MKCIYFFIIQFFITKSWCNLRNYKNEVPHRLGISNIFRYQDVIKEFELQLQYDFIIIGAGTSGSIVASRLSENPKWKILLLEAGDVESVITDIPLLSNTLDITAYAWQFEMEKQSNICLAFKNHKCRGAVGKAVGGSSVTNFMIYTRGTKYDWDFIANLGNKGWSYDEVLPYFKKIETTNIGDSETRGKYGPLNVEYIKYKTNYSDIFLRAVMELGNNITDYNSGEIGFNYVQANIVNGQRHSVAKAFLYSHKNRINLHILPRSKVTKINIDFITKKVISVQFSHNGKNQIVNVKKEIILTAGALSSPQILMLSGIGPREHLTKLGILVIEDLKVGENLGDHIMFSGMNILTDEPMLDIIDEHIQYLKNMLKWLYKKEGIFVLPAGIEAIGFLNTNVTINNPHYADIELGLFSLPISFGNNIIKSITHLSDDFYNDVYKFIEKQRNFSIVPILLNTKSKGQVKLKDKNPYRWPKIISNYYSNEKDLDTMVAAIRYIQKMIKTRAFNDKMKLKLHKSHYPTCKQYIYDTDEYWKCAIKTLTISLRHYVGTCKMGPLSDRSAVVDTELKVKGISGLRIADASVIPQPITGHTAAPVMMVGEKVADLIKNTWKNYK